MENYFIVHGSFGNSKEHYLPWLAKELSKKGEVISLDYPIGKYKQNFDNWEKVLLQFKDKISEDSVFIGRSIAPIFIVKFCLKHKIKIKKLVSISGFNGLINIPDYDYVNKTFLFDSVKEFKKYCRDIVCIYSDNDPYVPYSQLEKFSKNLATTTIIVKNAGHFNSDSGYDKKFEKLLELL